MKPQLDPQTGERTDDDTTSYTYEQVAGIRVPCPKCGSPVRFAPRDTRSLETVGDRHYQIGRHTFNCRCFSPAVD